MIDIKVIPFNEQATILTALHQKAQLCWKRMIEARDAGAYSVAEQWFDNYEEVGNAYACFMGRDAANRMLDAERREIEPEWDGTTASDFEDANG